LVTSPQEKFQGREKEGEEKLVKEGVNGNRQIFANSSTGQIVPRTFGKGVCKGTPKVVILRAVWLVHEKGSNCGVRNQGESKVSKENESLEKRPI